MKQPAIIVDLDGTLCNTDHRQHFMEQKKKDWDSFYAGIPLDKQNEWCAELIASMDIAGYQIIFLTGRPFEKNIERDTKEWLFRHGYSGFPLFHRKAGDYRKDAIIKEELYREHIEPFYDILFCVDDRKQVVDMWRRIGLTCLQCSEGDF